MPNHQIKEKSGKRVLMPAEWNRHSATLLVWPHNRETWPGSRLDAVEAVYQALIRTLLKYESVILLAADQQVKNRAVKLLQGYESLPFPLKTVEIPVNDVWVRDFGPICVHKESEVWFTDWEYNAWGGKYPPWKDDNAVPGTLGGLMGIPVDHTGMVLEGGSVETNGEGDFLVTESVLLNPNRNPTRSKEEIEEMLRKHLGAENVIWLKRGLLGDDTDGHIDDLTRFVNKNTVITALPESTSDPNYPALAENQKILNHAVLNSGQKLNVIPVPLPETESEEATVDGSDRVPASYANFYIANDVVLLPLYDERYDSEMMKLFRQLFPDREIEGIPCRDLVWGQGSLHCITQQLYGVNTNFADAIDAS